MRICYELNKMKYNICMYKRGLKKFLRFLFVYKTQRKRFLQLNDLFYFSFIYFRELKAVVCKGRVWYNIGVGG